MVYETFIHIDPDAFHDKELTLHDCIADRISLQNHILRFYLPEGLWVTTHHKENLSGDVLRTDAAVVEFSAEDADDITVHVFTRSTWRRSTKTQVENWHIEQLLSAVNSGMCTLEFITQYRSYHEQMWHCAIRSNRKPYYRECQLYLPNSKATFYWNSLCPDRKW